MTHKILTSLLFTILVSGGLDGSVISAQCSTNRAGSNDSSSCAGTQCYSDTEICAGPRFNGTPAGGISGAATAIAPETMHLQVPNLNPPLSPELGGDTSNRAGAEGDTSSLSSRMVGPLDERSEFERFAEDVTGRPLPVYGRRLFHEAPTTFAPLDRVPLPADYVLGPGDQLLVRAWGKISLDAAVTVDRNGQISLPTVGTLTVAGLPYNEINRYLQSAIARIYKGFELNVTIGQLRSMQVFVLGNARQPGAYTISSLCTLVNALFISGGPSATGSMRRIELRRDNQVLTYFDVYDLLRKGDTARDIRLLPGDVIYIPAVGPQVAIAGSVGEPGVYELQNSATIADVLKDAGNLTSLAGTTHVLLERIENHSRRVDEFSLNAEGLGRVLQDGDILELFPISPRIHNAVTLQGSVAHPGHYPWREGLRVSDLIPSRDFLIPRRYWNQQNHLVPSSAQFGPEDTSQEPSNAASASRSGTRNPDRSAEELFANVRSEIQPSKAREDGLQQSDRPKPIDIMDEIAQNSAEINWEYAAIERLDQRDLSTHVIAFNLGRALDQPASSDNQILQPGDVITILSRRDLPLPQDQQAAFVRVSGEVNAPGIYRIRSGETLRELVARAGGITSHAYLYASQLTRVSARLAEEEQLKLSIAQMQRELVSRYGASATLGASNADLQRAQFNDEEAAIAQLSAEHPTGRVVLDMSPRAGAIADLPEFRLEDGDSFYIPPRLDTVQVAGAVYNEKAFRYQPRKRLANYLADAGGATRQADVKHIFLVRADGTVVGRQGHGTFRHENFNSLTLLPGDAIIVPTKLRSPGGLLQQLPFISQMASQTALTGAVIGTVH